MRGPPGLQAGSGAQPARHGLTAQSGEDRKLRAEEGESVQDGRHVQLLDHDLPLMEEVVDALPDVSHLHVVLVHTE